MDRELMLCRWSAARDRRGIRRALRQSCGCRDFGFAGAGYHARDECIELDSIVPRLYLMTRLLTEIGNN
jgi:glutamate carboxypeptidase